MSFYKDFIDNIQNENNIMINKKYYNNYFKNYLIKYFQKNFTNIINDDNNEIYIDILCIYLKVYLNKPQRLLEDNKDYYIAIDMLTNTKYICFKNFCILDFDINKNNFTIKNDILEYINNNNFLNNVPYYIIESERGFHIYLLDEERAYNSIETFYFINNFNSDDIYKFYCYLRGYSIRLSLKEGDTYLYKNIKLVKKNKKIINSKLNYLFKMHCKLFI